MDIILTESQYMQLLVEKNENKIASVFDKSRDFTKKLISDVKEQYNIDFTFLGTWGSVIGGFARPISKYMEGTYPNLTDQDITLITFGIILTFFSNNKEKLNKVLQLIKEKGIITFFDRAMLNLCTMYYLHQMKMNLIMRHLVNLGGGGGGGMINMNMISTS